MKICDLILEHLQDHPGCGVSFAVNRIVDSSIFEGPINVTSLGHSYILNIGTNNTFIVCMVLTHNKTQVGFGYEGRNVLHTEIVGNFYEDEVFTKLDAVLDAFVNGGKKWLSSEAKRDALESWTYFDIED